MEQIIWLLIFIIMGLIAFAVMQIKQAGMNVKDFVGFVQANQMLENLYNASKGYDKMTQNQQLVFLIEAEKVFNAFDKVPNLLWEDEYQKYIKILELYRDIKVLRWSENKQ